MDSTTGYVAGGKRKEVINSNNLELGKRNIKKGQVRKRGSINETLEYIVLEKGSTHSNVEILKSNLNRLGFGSLTETDYFDKYTKKALKDFQNYYKLEVSGRADIPTLQKIDYIVESSFQLNSKSKDIISLKRKLNWLGYSKIKVTDKFGLTLERCVKNFQNDNRLPVNGIVDKVTMGKIDEVFMNRYKLGSKHDTIKDLKYNLNCLGFDGILETKLYGAFTERRVKEFQTFYDLKVTGQADYSTFSKIEEILSSPIQFGNRHNDVIQLKRDLMTLGYGPIQITNKFGKLTKKLLKRFQSDYGLPISGIADNVTLKKIEKAIRYTERVTYSRYDISLEEVLDIQMNHLRKNAERTKVERFLNPVNFLNHEKGKFQFLDLSKPNVVSIATINNYLTDKGMLEGAGQTFIEAGRHYGVNELYLLLQALLKTDYGTSILANGVPVDKNGDITYTEIVENGLETKVLGMTETTEKMVYNMYAISDNNNRSIASCVKKAYNEGWDTPYKAIIGGAKYIREKYIKYDNNTLYNMLWHPAHMSIGSNLDDLYNVDLDWILDQVDQLHYLYYQMESYNLYLEIPVYNDQSTLRYQRG